LPGDRRTPRALIRPQGQLPFQRTGFRGALNWYRAVRSGPELLAAWRGTTIRQPSLFIAGDRDDVMKFSTTAAAVARFSQSLPGLRGSHVLSGAGHWVQRERAADVNSLLIEFLRGL
jgi:pimeloyl-ACP methyl ester carboxylesterase